MIFLEVRKRQHRQLTFWFCLTLPTENLFANDDGNGIWSKAIGELETVDLDDYAVRAVASHGGSTRRGAKKGMILPFQQHSISFNDIKYYIDMPAEMKSQTTESKLELLHGITGAFRPGVLTALVGVSGAGKTTLMDVLAGRKTGGYIEGDIKISGFPKKQETFARIAGYCEQNDIHSPQVTVRESLVYSAWLRLPKEISKETREVSNTQPFL
jgi:ABC-type glutathione transport system ATPase component